jgi:hypothetical protein
LGGGTGIERRPDQQSHGSYAGGGKICLPAGRHKPGPLQKYREGPGYPEGKRRPYPRQGPPGQRGGRALWLAKILPEKLAEGKMIRGEEFEEAERLLHEYKRMVISYEKTGHDVDSLDDYYRAEIEDSKYRRQKITASANRFIGNLKKEIIGEAFGKAFEMMGQKYTASHDEAKQEAETTQGHLNPLPGQEKPELKILNYFKDNGMIKAKDGKIEKKDGKCILTDSPQNIIDWFFYNNSPFDLTPIFFTDNFLNPNGMSLKIETVKRYFRKEKGTAAFQKEHPESDVFKKIYKKNQMSDESGIEK